MSFWNRFSRRTQVLILSYVTAAQIVGGGFFLQRFMTISERADNYALQLSLSGSRSFSELSTYLSEIDTALQKSVYATSPSFAASLCTEIYGKSLAAKLTLGELPYSHVTLTETYTFVSRLGDYALSLSRRAAAQEVYNEGDLKNLQALAKTASWLSQGVLDMQRKLQNGEMTLETLEQTGERLRTPASVGAAGGGAFQSMEQEFPEVPSLVYDGPFSQHLEQQSPRSLEGAKEFSQEQAQKAAAEFFGMENGSLSLSCQSEGKLPFYGFAGGKNGEFFATVSKLGGVPILMYRTGQTGQEKVSIDEALKTAAGFLKERGYPEMHESYHMKSGSIVTVNFAATQDGVILYPDLVKVSVCLIDGKIAGFEATGYVMNHMKREIPAPAVTEEQARAQVAGNLSVLSHQMAIIPTAGKNEAFCHEFICENEYGAHCLVYVNAKTGMQEKIMLLIEDESGTLAI